MFEFLKGIVLKFLKVPPEPPAPFGDEDKLMVFRASPNFFRYKFVLWCIGQVITLFTLGAIGLGLLIAALTSEEPLAAGALVLLGLLIFGFLLVQSIFSYVMMRLDYEMRWYKITDRSLRIREGVVHVREMTMTFANIQNMSITQGPIQRALKISDLRVQTAGGGAVMAEQQQGQSEFFNMHIGYFRGVDNAEEIQEIMRDRLKRLRDAGLGDQDDSRAGEGEEGAPERSAVATPVVATEVIAAAGELLTETLAFRRAVEKLAER